MKCPICTSSVELLPGGAKCSSGHSFGKCNDVYQLVSPDYASKLHPFLKAFEKLRAPEINKINSEYLAKLPFTDENPEIWKLRQLDLELIKKYCRPSYKTALEIGAWNGWLTQHLVKLGLETTAVDHFTHPIDGLGAQQYYNEKWLSLQIDFENLHILDQKFDLIVLNRCLFYFESPSEILQQLKPLLNDSGTIVFTGLTYVRNPKQIVQKLNTLSTHFEETYRVPFYFKNYRGYLTKSDINALSENGVKIDIYKSLQLQSLIGKMFSKRPVYFYGIFKD